MRLKGVSMMKSKMITKMLIEENVLESHLPVRTIGMGENARDNGERALVFDDLPAARLIADAEREVRDEREEEHKEHYGDGVEGHELENTDEAAENEEEQGRM